MNATTLNELAAEANSIAVDEGSLNVAEFAHELSDWSRMIHGSDHILQNKERLTVLSAHALIALLNFTSLLDIDIEAAVTARLTEARAKGLD